MDAQNYWFSSGAAGGGGGDPGDPIGESLRGRGPGTGRLARTPAAAGNRQTYTISFWLKYAGVSNSNYLYAAERFQANTSSDVGHFGGNAGAHDPATNISWRCGTTRFRDPSAWYHWVFVGDTTNATEADRIRFYINGERITISGTNLITQNYNTGWNAAVTTTIFDAADTSDAGNNNLQGCIADFYNMDGLALEPECFGRLNDDGVWVPRTGSRQDLATPRDFNAADYGANGFHLTFADPDDLGEDTAPIGATGHTAANNFTATGFDTAPVGIFSNQTTATNGGFDASFPATNMFDGSLSTMAAAANSNGVITFEPNPQLNFTNGVHMNVNHTAGSPGEFRITVSGTTGAWTAFPNPANSNTALVNELATGAGRLDRIEVRRTDANRPAVVAVGLNGTTTNDILVDNTGEDYDHMADSPTQNFATLNPLNTTGGEFGIQSANLEVSGTLSTTAALATGSIAMTSGRYYFEVVRADVGVVGEYGIKPADTHITGNVSGYNDGVHVESSGTLHVNGEAAQANYLTPLVENDVLNVAFNADTRQVWFGRNGTFVGDPAAGTNPAGTHDVSNTGYIPWIRSLGSNTTITGRETSAINAGQQNDFIYTPPTGFEALQTQNLPAAPIANGRDHFEAITWDGNDVDDRAITTTEEFAPGLVWIKCRDSAINHFIYDTVRDAPNRLFPNLPNEEDAGAGNLKSFTDNGFTLGTSGNVNGTGNTYVAWCWRAGGAAVTNDDGDIESQVSANTDAGFSIVTYTGVNPAATIGHGLNQAPEFIIVKNRDDSRNWTVLHTGVGTNGNSTFFGADDYNMLQLNTTDSAQTFSADLIYPDPDNNGTTFGVGNAAQVNGNGDDMIAYCWHSVPGYSAFGSYTGNGDDDGPFIYTGFRPAFVMVKSLQSGGSWGILDSTRSINNPVNEFLTANDPQSEFGASNAFDLLSNGFKLRSDWGSANNGSRSYIYAAFAENPFGSSNTAPANAR